MSPFERAGCAGKFRFATANEAMRTAWRSGVHSNHYRCKYCGGWHVGRGFDKKQLNGFRKKKQQLIA